MYKLLITLGLITLTGCAMSPETIHEEVAECSGYSDLVPVVVVGKQLAVKRVYCTVRDDVGYTVVDRDFKLISLPKKKLEYE